MSAYKTSLTFALLLLLLGPCITSDAGERPWYAGTWDSRYNPVLDHPRTIAIRMELLDRDTHIPVSDVQISLEGQYYQMWISQDIAIAKDVSWWNLFVDPNKREPQPREFKLDAVSGSDGVVVFALQWQKEFPWDSYFDGHPPRDSKPDGSWTTKDSWMLAVDDIEKVKRLEIRHPRYRYIEAPLDFQHVVGLEQYLSPQRALGDKYKVFEQNWKNEIHRRNVKMFVLDLGTGFPEFKKQSCTRPEFFSRIRAKEYGEIYQVLENLPQWDEGKKCGPYFVYDLGEILMEPVASRLEVQGPSASILTQDAQSQGTPWYRQYSRQADATNIGRREESMQGQSTTTRAGIAGPDRQEREPSMQSRPSLKEILSDPAKLRDAVQKATAMKNQLAVAGIRALPLPDPDTGQMTTLDAYARKLAADAGVGGTLGEDPVATAYMMLIDSNFLTDEARMIQLADGRYGTLNQAIDAAADSNSGLDPEVLRGAVTAVADLQQGQRAGEGELLSKAVTTLAGAVSRANAPRGGVAPTAMTPVAQGIGPKLANGPSVSEDQALYCPELSMSVKTLTPELRKEFGLYTGVEGAVIVRIDTNAPPGHDDLKPGMVVYSLGRALIADADSLAQEARRIVSTPATVRGSGRDQVLLSFWRRSGASWERGSKMIWVMGKRQADRSDESAFQFLPSEMPSDYRLLDAPREILDRVDKLVTEVVNEGTKCSCRVSSYGKVEGLAEPRLILLVVNFETQEGLKMHCLPFLWMASFDLSLHARRYSPYICKDGRRLVIIGGRDLLDEESYVDPCINNYKKRLGLESLPHENPWCVAVEPLSEAHKKHLGRESLRLNNKAAIPPTIAGVVVTFVYGHPEDLLHSLEHDYTFEVGTIICAINGRAISTRTDFDNELNKLAAAMPGGEMQVKQWKPGGGLFEVPFPRESAKDMKRIQIANGLNGIQKAMLIYANDHDDKYPEPSRWCDVSIREAEVSEEMLRGYQGSEKTCIFAMNSNAGVTCHEPGIVLFFETEPGWNQHGGRELISAARHGGRGCMVGFTDGHMEFVRAEDFSKLIFKS